MKKTNKISLFVLFSLCLILFSSKINAAVYGYRTISGFQNYYFKDSNSSTIFNSDVTTYTAITKSDYARFVGYARSAWYGHDPYNADTIVHSNTFIVRGLGSISVSGGALSTPEVSVSTTGNSATYTYQLNNEWILETNYDVKLKTSFGVSFDQEAGASFQFGNDFYTYTVG